MTPDWGQTKMRVVFGPIPQFGTILRTASGRLYQVIGVRGAALTVLVLPKSTSLAGEEVWDWRWAPRAKKAGRSLAATQSALRH